MRCIQLVTAWGAPKPLYLPPVRFANTAPLLWHNSTLTSWCRWELLKRAVFSAWRNKNAVAYPSNLWFLFNQFDKEEIGDEQILYLDSHVNARKRSCAKAKKRLRRSRCAQTSTREALFKGVLTHICSNFASSSAEEPNSNIQCT